LTEIASSLPLSTIENIGITGIECIFLTIVIFLVTRFLLARKSIPVLYPLSALLVFIIVSTTREISIRETSELIVYNSIGSSTIGIRNGNVLHIYSDILPAGQEVKRHSAMLDLKIMEHKFKDDACHLKAGGKDILITKSISSNILDKTSPDYIILTGTNPLLNKNIQWPGSPEAIIICPTVTNYYRISKATGIINNCRVHYIGKQGAFYCKL
jgi:hypothetical protein